MRTLPLLVAGLCLSASVWAEKPARLEPILPVKPAVVEDQAKVELGKKLFFEPRISASGFFSCNSCHNLSRGGSDNLQTSIGHNWAQGPINSPTVLNSSLNFVQFWDGRAKDLKEQAGGPIANPLEMAFTHDLAVKTLNTIPGYVEEYKAVFGKDKIDIDGVTEAIAAFEETLVTPNARFDKWLKGDDNAITKTELEGYELFKSIGCIACHNGEGIGGSTFQKMGLVQPYVTFNEAEGRGGLTGKDAERMMFKVPTLRNVELTAPYFHDGAVWTLEEAVDIMARLQLGRELNEGDVAKVVAFLKTLTGDQPDFKLPILPPSSNETPRPNPWAGKKAEASKG